MEQQSAPCQGFYRFGLHSNDGPLRDPDWDVDMSDIPHYE